MVYKIRDPLSSYSDLELALMVLLNVFGSGLKRRKALGDRYTAVQTKVNKITSSGYIDAASSGTDVEKVRRVLEELRPTDQDYTDFINDFINALKEAK